MILTSLPPLSCQSPLPRSNKTRLTLLSWAASVPGAESKKTQVYHVYRTLGVQTRATRTCIVWAFLFLFAIGFISPLAFSVFVCHRCCRIAFLGRDVCSLFCLGRFVSFRSRLGLFALCCANVCPLGVSFVWVCHRCHISNHLRAYQYRFACLVQVFLYLWRY